MTTILLINAKKYYKELPHQKEAVEYLGNLLLNTPAKQRLSLKTKTDWIKSDDKWLEWLQNQISSNTLEKFASIWRQDVKAENAEPHPPSDKVIEQARKQVYYIQLDNNRKPYSVCNSVAHAMLLKYMLPKALPNDRNADQVYVNKVLSGAFGRKGYRNPSIYWDVQSNGMKYYGLNTRINTSHDRPALESQVSKGIPTPVNISYKSSGHVICLVGVDATHFDVFDPYGEMDYVSGRYIRYTNVEFNSGKYRVSKAGFYRRWQSVFTQVIQ
jgi:uncharacterized protein YvpB